MNLQEFFEICMDREVPKVLDPQQPQINLGIGSKEIGPEVQSIGLPEWDAETDPIPYGDESVGTVWALHFLEHIGNVFYVLRECERVLRPGGILNVVVPYGACHMWVHDLSHKHMFNEDTWRVAFGNPYYDDQGPWRFRVHLNIIMAVKGENLALLSQLIKE